MSVYDQYREQVVPAWCKEHNFSSPHEVPRIEKVSLNMGLKDASTNRSVPEAALTELALITGQRPVLTKARKSIAGFKLREGMVIGAKVTLRRSCMYDFLDRLIKIALPRVRDFRGLSARAFDGRGNYSIGLPEQIVFPEINLEKIQRVRGLDVTIVTNTDDDEQARMLMLALGLPLRDLPTRH